MAQLTYVKRKITGTAKKELLRREGALAREQKNPQQEMYFSERTARHSLCTATTVDSKALVVKTSRPRPISTRSINLVFPQCESLFYHAHINLLAKTLSPNLSYKNGVTQLSFVLFIRPNTAPPFHTTTAASNSLGGRDTTTSR